MYGLVRPPASTHSTAGSTISGRHLDEVFVRINGETHYLWRALSEQLVYVSLSVPYLLGFGH
jgi:transposase-like protein